MKILSSFIDINEFIVDLANISNNIDRIVTLAQSRRLSWLLEPRGANLQALDVH